MSFLDTINRIIRFAPRVVRDTLSDLAGSSHAKPFFIEILATTAEQKHRKFEERIWNANLILSIVTAIAVGLGAFFAYKTFKETQRQADATEDEGRPYVIIDNASILEISYIGDEVLIEVKAFLKDVGKGPSFGITYTGSLYLLPDPAAQAVDCHTAEKDVDLSLFDDKSFGEVNFVFFRKKSTILPVIAEQLAQDISDLPKNLPDTIRNDTIKRMTKGRYSPAFEFDGCLNYRDVKSNPRSTLFRIYLFETQKFDVRDENMIAPANPILIQPKAIRYLGVN